MCKLICDNLNGSISVKMLKQKKIEFKFRVPVKFGSKRASLDRKSESYQQYLAEKADRMNGVNEYYIQNPFINS